MADPSRTNQELLEENGLLRQRIQDLEKSESALKESEYRFHLVRDISMEAFTILCCIRDAQGKITDFEWTYANPAAGQILKHRPEKLVGKRLLDVLPGNRENRDLFDRYVHIVETGQGDEVELEYRSGEISGWFRNMTVKLGDGVAVSFSDITQRKQAEAVLKQRKDGLDRLVAERTSELGTVNLQLQHEIAERKRVEESLCETNEYLDNLFNYANAPIILWNPQFRITRFNQAFEYLTGRTAGEVLGQAIDLLFPPEKSQFTMELIQKTLNGERWQTVEIEILHRDGTVLTVLWNSATIFDSDGKTPIATIAQGQDISERKQALELLRESEEKYHNLYLQASLGIFHSTFEGKFIDINPALARMLGYDSPEDAINLITSIPEQIYAEAPKRDAVLTKAIESGGFVSVENSYRRRDGALWYGMLHLRIVNDQQGRPSHYEGFVEDITDRKKVEDELRKTLRLLNSISESSTDAIYIKDIKGRYLLFNKEAARVTGKRPEEVIGKDDSFLFPAEEAMTVMGGDRRVMESKQVMTYEEFITTSEGARTYLSVKGPLYDDKGKVFGIFGIARDITIRKHAEQMLRLHSEIMTNMTEGVILVRAKDGIIVYANPKYEEMFGYDSGELIDRHISIVNAPGEKSPKEIAKEIVSQLREKGTWKGEVNCRKKDLTHFWCYANVSSFNHAEYGEVWISVHSDITERKKIMAELESSYRQLRVFNQRWVEIEELERKRLSAELHDEIGQNLTALGINLSVARMSLPPETDPIVYGRIDESVNLLKRTTTHIKGIMSNLRPTVLDEYGLVPALRWHVEENSKRTGIEISFAAAELPCRLATEIEAALFRIAQEAMNNAIKHARTNRIDMTLDYSENKLILVIVDDGIGFETQAVQDQDDHGWGLMIMRERCLGVKGRFRAESTPGQGTRISVEVPL